MQPTPVVWYCLSRKLLHRTGHRCQPVALTRSMIGYCRHTQCRLSARLSVTKCKLAPRIRVGAQTLYCPVPMRRLPIHFFRHFCSRTYRLATKLGDKRTAETSASGSLCRQNQCAYGHSHIQQPDWSMTRNSLCVMPVCSKDTQLRQLRERSVWRSGNIWNSLPIDIRITNRHTKSVCLLFVTN